MKVFDVENAFKKSKLVELANSKEYQLYNLSEDISQQHNLAKENTEKLQEMIAAYEAI